MYEKKPLSEVRPACRLVCEEMPPLGVRLWLISKYGNGFPGEYHPEFGVVAWAPLPKMTEEQKRKVEEMENEKKTQQTRRDVTLPATGCCAVFGDKL